MGARAFHLYPISFWVGLVWTRNPLLFLISIKLEAVHGATEAGGTSARPVPSCRLGALGGCLTDIDGCH